MQQTETTTTSSTPIFRVYKDQPNDSYQVPLVEDGIIKEDIGDIKLFVQKSFNFTDLSFNLVLHDDSNPFVSSTPLSNFTGIILLKIQPITTTTSTKGPQSKKIWTFADNVNRDIYYYIDFKKLQIDQLITCATQGGCHLIQGAYRSGKTSHLVALENELFYSKKYFPMVFRMSKTTNIWEWFNKVLHRYVPQAPNITNEDDMLTTFDSKNKNLFGNKQVVFLFDEFQELEYKPFRENFLLSLKSLMEDIDLIGVSTCVHAILGFGTFLLKHFESDGDKEKTLIHSPFLYKNNIYLKPLPEEAVHNLLSQWADKFILIRYPGLLGLVGLTLQSHIVDSTFIQDNIINFDWWRKIRIFTMASLYSQTDQFTRLIKQFKRSKDVIGLARHVLTNQGPFEFQGDQLKYAYLLADHGVLSITYINNGSIAKFSISSPLLKEFLIEEFYRPIPNFIPNNFGIQSLLQNIVSHMDPTIFTVNESHNITTGFPSEYAFQAEFYAIIRHGLNYSFNGEYIAIIEAKNQSIGSERSESLVKNGRTIVFELKSLQKWKSFSDINPVIKQASRYAKSLGATEIVVLNFVSSPTQFSAREEKNVNGNTVYVYEIVFNNKTLTLNLPGEEKEEKKEEKEEEDREEKMEL
ncbi:hypothetical protein DLAC_06663 [Tieghemostelium lacteum]|uniref:Uncharacterized protein n=1 Tax=Tieghemostelium lacteum TaxID=361077 RepID=A0A151ZFC6_TIELA|nr:hypothetical protein DLAC_06663 [Tieghemostelium lacteum]|eukprot:KYQ92668.1 hypothetical protein DLAC_06663 [Tieghemostelium lacteum]